MNINHLSANIAAIAAGCFSPYPYPVLIGISFGFVVLLAIDKWSEKQ